MIKTKIKKIIAGIWISAVIISSFGSAFAATKIGTGSVVWDATLNSDIMWDESYPGNATGSVNGIKIKARVLPTISMVISANEIDLGDLDAWIEATWSLNIEIGTNAANWVILKAKSWNGGLTNTADNNLKINNDAWVDGIAEDYTFSSVANTHDSTVDGFTQSSNVTTTQITNSDELTIYSTNKPEQTNADNADVVFNVAAEINSQTAAWDYEDNITFTIIGKF